MESVGRSWKPWVWTEHVLTFIALSLDDVDVLQDKLASLVLELNAHLAQKLKGDPREGGAIICLAAVYVKEMSRQIDDNVYDLQKHLVTLPWYLEGKN